jgi:hypothetical protein
MQIDDLYDLLAILDDLPETESRDRLMDQIEETISQMEGPVNPD